MAPRRRCLCCGDVARDEGSCRVAPLFHWYGRDTILREATLLWRMTGSTWELQDAGIRNVEVIGEAASGPRHARQPFPTGLDWKAIYRAMRALCANVWLPPPSMYDWRQSEKQASEAADHCRSLQT